MARNALVSCPVGEATELSNAENAAGTITFNVRIGREVIIIGTTDGTAPSSFDNGIEYVKGQGERNVTLAQLFPGITAVRFWAWPTTDAAKVFVSYE